jgi:hypothetical protein
LKEVVVGAGLLVPPQQVLKPMMKAVLTVVTASKIHFFSIVCIPSPVDGERFQIIWSFSSSYRCEIVIFPLSQVFEHQLPNRVRKS